MTRPAYHQPGLRSVSQFGTYSACGEQYRLQKVVKAPGSPAAWFHQGTAFHGAIERYEGSGRLLDPTDVLDTFDGIWQAEHDEALLEQPDINQWMTGGRTKAQTDIDNRFLRGRQQCLDYVAWADTQPWRVVELAPDEYAVEMEFSMMLNGVTVRGSIDQLVQYPDGGYRVRDLKTGTKLPAWPFQLAVYDLAVEDVLGFRPGWGDYYMSKNADVTDAYPLLRFTPEIVGSWFADMDTAERAGLYLPNPGDACRTCGVSKWCLAVGGNPDAFSPHREMEKA